MKNRLKKIILEKSVFFGDFTLSSGKKSKYYIDARISTLFPESAYLIGELIYKMLEPWTIDAIGGYSIGADPIVTAVSIVSFLKENPIPAFIIRKETKQHGRGKQIEGNFKKGMKVAVVDDVITTGNSIINGINAVKENGGEVVVALSVIDREEEGKEKIEAMGVPYIPIFTLKDLNIKK
jgi:orotate phosphoribosyltransferase